MITKLPTFDDARRAVRGGKDPMAFLRLGIIYTKGIGTRENHVIANYFFDKAACLGCEEAYSYIIREYVTVRRYFGDDLERELSSYTPEDSAKLDRYRKIVEGIRARKEYGLMSRANKFIPLLYPDYDKEKGIADILDDRDSRDADIYYALSTFDNWSEVNVESQDKFLEQLHAPVVKDKKLIRKLKKCYDREVFSKDARDLLQSLVNYTSTYDALCKANGIKPREILRIETIEVWPYIKASTLFLLRKQIVRCLLSIRDVDPIINSEFLNNLREDEKLLNISEKIEDEDVQLFLISFVELHLVIDSIEQERFEMLMAYRNNFKAPLAEYLNEFVERLTKYGIEHHLTAFSTKNLPTIQLSDSIVD